ncbi:nuclear fragile X mental retardation-interacting protein 2-like [Drosophila hydei]|uniref:Nuclear fragile X mental retardation-interacting protein 2-like n=1 Tax=Drosophila hydei TaxID=7224 RepID=A0A6J2SSX3_DROHY|nr:nuclear fragile X mental retardation-interacting protein 2-like [Drosophila hydei]
MSNLSNVLPAKAKGSTSEAKSVQNSSTTMAAKSLPAGEQATRDENAPSTSQGRQHQSSHHSSHHSSQQRQVSAASCSNSHSHSHSHSHSYSHSRKLARQCQ